MGQRLRDAVRDMIERTRDYIGGEMGRPPASDRAVRADVRADPSRASRGAAQHLGRRAARGSADKQPSETAAAQVFELPLSSALVVTLIPTGWIYPQPPRVVISAVSILVLLPAVLIVRRLASPPIVPAVYALAAFFIVDRVRDVCSVVPILEQWVFLIEMVCGIVFLALAVRSERLLSGEWPGACLRMAARDRGGPLCAGVPTDRRRVHGRVRVHASGEAAR